ncbi:MAG: hypothetical protein LQ345_006329 [Seirophora villosa]|nr:MAG: hypothetical protein LQ345_006329 [Seirophora villosa]
MPASAPVSQDKVDSGLSLPNEISLGDPTPPPGFRVHPLYWDASRGEYDAREIWFNIVAAASLLAQFRQSQQVRVMQQYRLRISGETIYVTPRPLMTDGVLVWFFSEIGRQIATRYPFPHKVPKFWGEFSTAAGMGGGFMIGGPGQNPRGELERSFNASGADAVAAGRGRATTMGRRAFATADSGSRTCVDDPNLVIHYRFYRIPIPPGEVFTAFLTAQTFFSEHEEQDRGVNMLALSADRRVRLSVSDVRTGLGRNVLTIGLAREGLRTVWRDLVMGFDIGTRAFVGEVRWDSVSFTYEYRGVKIGQGTLGI